MHAEGQAKAAVVNLRDHRIQMSGFELQHMQPQVIERINGYFGYQAIGRIALQQGPIGTSKPARRKPAPPPSSEDAAALAAQLEDIADDELRQALDALGRGILGRKQRQK